MKRSIRLSCIFAALCMSAAIVYRSPLRKPAPTFKLPLAARPLPSSTFRTIPSTALPTRSSHSRRLEWKDLGSGITFRDDVTDMAVNGKYLFASTRNGIYVAAFAINPMARFVGRINRHRSIRQGDRGARVHCSSTIPAHRCMTSHSGRLCEQCAAVLQHSKSTGLLHNSGQHRRADFWMDH